MNIYSTQTSNQITYEYFCILGGLSNKNTLKVLHKNGVHIYYTYYLISVK